MSFAAAHIAAQLAGHGPLVRVVVAEVAGSTPREVGADMLVWADGQSGTIGGGSLEYEAARQAREMLLAQTDRRLARVALGPDMGQCCGGRVTLVSERLTAAPHVTEGVYARPVAPDAGPMPLGVNRALARARDRGEAPRSALIDGWMIEAVAPSRTPIWVWGAGHVGRALVDILAVQPGLAVTWLDTGADRFDAVPEGVRILPAPELAQAMHLAPKDAHHVVMTYSHALDQAICDAGLAHGVAGLGLIGSDTKWARFRKRLTEAGHAPAAVDRIRCPIGDKRLGKAPAALAVGVAAQILLDVAQSATTAHEGTGYDQRLSGH